MHYLKTQTSARSKHLIFSCFIILLNIIFFQQSIAGENNKYKLTKVVIDAGHGGKDSGAPGKKNLEKDIVLSIALKTGEYITNNLPEVEVIYTRKTDVFIPLHERSKIANKNNADLFISIHANSSTNPKIIGTETFAMGLHKSNDNLEVAKLENSAILFEKDYETQYEGFDPNSPESYIIFSLLQNSFLEQSLDFASHVQGQFEQRVQRKNRGIKQAGFAVLWRTTMPSVLIEVGFLSNSTEEKFLGTEKGQDYIASAIYRALRDYKNKIEENNPTESKKDSTGNPKLVIKESTVMKDLQKDSIPVKKPDTIHSKKNDKIIFKVQIISSKNQIPINSSSFKGFKNIEEITINNLYKYTIGQETNYHTINEQRKKLANQFPGAFVIAFKNGVPISLSKALKEIKY